MSKTSSSGASPRTSTAIDSPSQEMNSGSLIQGTLSGNIAGRIGVTGITYEKPWLCHDLNQRLLYSGRDSGTTYKQQLGKTGILKGPSETRDAFIVARFGEIRFGAHVRFLFARKLWWHENRARFGPERCHGK